MKKILVIGAGRSASDLIRYFLEHAQENNWSVIVADQDLELAKEKIAGNPNGKAIAFDIHNDEQRKKEISTADLIVSLLPADMHIIPAKECLVYKKHLVTASYVSNEMASLNDLAIQAGVSFLNEIGVDPGIDHMSAMEIIERVREEGGMLKSFKSYCGGLISPEYNNQWGYKFTWAPRNVILAGQGTAVYLENGGTRYLPYSRLFSEIDSVSVPRHGTFDAYANRDSIKYIPIYGLEGISTLIRGTLRMPGYCRFWNAFVKMGITDDSFSIPHSDKMALSDFVFSFVKRIPGFSKEESLAKFLGEPVDGEVMKKIIALDLLSDEKIPLKNVSPAKILQYVLEKKWELGENDKDMLVLQHQFEYEKGGKNFRLTSSMVEIGEDTTYTAMSKTVGLPMAIAAKLILQEKITRRGVFIPIYKDVYTPVLQELSKYGIKFEEKEEEV